MEQYSPSLKHKRSGVAAYACILTIFVLWTASSVEAISGVDPWTGYVRIYNNWDSYVSQGTVYYDYANQRMRFDGRTLPDTDDDPFYTEIKDFSKGILYFILDEIGGKQCFIESEVSSMKYSGYQSAGNTIYWYYDSQVVNGINTYLYQQIINGNMMYWFYFSYNDNALVRMAAQPGQWICPYWENCYWSSSGQTTYWDISNFLSWVDPNVFIVPDVCKGVSGSIMDFPGNTYIVS